jgi:uncharacterized membrane protein
MIASSARRGDAMNLLRGLPGHPSHPPLTDATIGIYTFAAIAAVLSALGVSEAKTAQAWALALLVGLIVSVPTMATGFADWLQISRGTPLWRTATSHMVAMAVASALFLIAIGAGYGDGIDGDLTSGALILTLVGFAVLALGGWIGGSIVFVHGMRVLELPEEPAHRAMSPVPSEEKRQAEQA